MGKPKVTKIKNQPKNEKKAKSTKNPDSYLSMPISWQFGLMDFEFEHGWEHVIDRIEFSNSLKDELLISLADSNCNADLYSLIDKLNPSDHRDIHNFLDSLKAIDTITTDEFLCILRVVQKNFFWQYLFPKFKEIETKKWSELEKETFGRHGKSKNHWVDVNAIIKPAQDRLGELNMDDHERIYSMRLTGTQRIWGIRLQNYFRLLWFDFNHQICPSLRE
jgi:hypothetical protein